MSSLSPKPSVAGRSQGGEHPEASAQLGPLADLSLGSLLAQQRKAAFRMVV